MLEVKISRELLENLRMLSDKQLEQMGYDPVSITVACLQVECEPNAKPKPKFFPSCS